MSASVNDRLFDELIRPVTEDYFESAKKAAILLSVPATAGSPSALRVLGRMEALEEFGDRTARVIDVAEPLWEDMRAMAGLES